MTAPDATDIPPARFADDELLRPVDVASEYRIPVGTLASYRSRGVGPRSFKRLGRVVYRRSEVEKWLTQCEQNSVAS